MEVDPTTAPARVEHKRQTLFFCNTGCAEAFRQRPEQYLERENTKLRLPLAVHTQSAAETAAAEAYVCPMHPEVRESVPGACSKCGMALEAEMPSVITRTEYACPMHPDAVQSEPGTCLICGMALEPRVIAANAEGPSPELRDMTRRFWVRLTVSFPLIFIAMANSIPGEPLARAIAPRLTNWIELVLATPVVLWGGWPFFQRGWKSIVNRSLNMFTLIGMGIGVAYAYSSVAATARGIFPRSFRGASGTPEVYFEVAAAITVLVLLGQVLELRARSRTNTAIRALLDLSPKMARKVADDGTEKDVTLDQVRSFSPSVVPSCTEPPAYCGCCRSVFPSLFTPSESITRAAASAAASVTMEKITSAASQTARGDSAHCIPRSINHCTFDGVRLNPVTA